MKKRSRYLLIGLAIIFSACEDKDMQATSPTFDVNVDKLEYAPGEEVKFNISGNAQYVSFYSGEMYNDYACRDGRVVEHEGLKMSFYFRKRFFCSLDRYNFIFYLEPRRSDIIWSCGHTKLRTERKG